MVQRKIKEVPLGIIASAITSSLNTFSTTTATSGISSPIMEETIIASVVRKLGDVAATEIALLLGLKEELDNLFSEFSAIKRVLHDAEMRQINDESVRGWLQNLKYVAYDLDDLLEEWRILMEVDAVTTSPFTNCFGDQVILFTNCLFHFTNCFGSSSSSTLTSLIKHPFRHLKYRKRVDEIKSRLEQIAREKERYRFSDDTRVRRMREERRTDPWVDQTSVIGRDEDKKTLVTKLISEEGSITCGSGSDKVPTIFILGMGGLGKTTLAKSVLNDEKVKEHFDKRMWVCVGEDFKMEDIMKSMIESWGESVKPSLREQLAELLKDKRYLLILDDVWNENYEKWERLEEILNQGAKDSRIVITTRNTGVVAKIRSAYTHELKDLNEDECLSIFKKVVIEPGKEKDYEPLMDIGKQIVGKCGGLALAVKTIASAVRGRRHTREQWEMVRNSKIWDLKESDEGILPALMLSYTELTPQLKNCFGYCSIFKKDTLLEKDELVRLWVSQGYIVVNDRRREEEEVGEECFEELLARSMFQEPERDDDGTITRCKMHDLVHDLAQRVTKEECRIIGNDDANNNNNALLQLAGARHCAVEPEMSIVDINLARVEKLRTLISRRYGSTPEPIDTVLKSLKSVRVLKLRNCSVSHHSWEHLGKLVHLRHLELSHNMLTQLPAVSIETLKELRYLDLSNSCIKTLPENIGTLSSLRQLNVSWCTSLVNLPKTIAPLPHLQVINLEGCSGLEELPELNESLRQLNVSYCDSLVNLPKTIVSLPHLQVLNLSNCSRLEELPELKGLSSLRQLIVEECDSLVNLPKTIVSLPHLQVINLRNCSSLEELPELKDLSSLRQLNVSRCTSLVNLPKTIVSLPHLQVISLEGCSILEELPELKDLSSLRQLNVSWCTSLVNLPKTIVSLPHLQVINLRNCFCLKELPEGILEMTSLRRLNVEGCRGLKKLPNGIGRQKDVVVILDRFLVEEAGGDEVGGCSRSNIGELGGMNIRADYLHICNLKEVGSRDEARTAKLEEKTSLHSLYLSWNEMDEVIEAAADGVLEGLRPPPNLLTLQIKDYPGQTFPSWMGDGGAAFRHLREVELWNCKNCNQLPPLGELPSLEKLFIYGLDGVERVGREFFGGPSPTFPCLMDLTFQHMRNWSDWVALSPISSEGEDGSSESPIMPAAERLKFIDCPKLEAMPPIFTTSLRRLTVDDSSPMLYHRSSLQFLPLPLCETISIFGNRWSAKSMEDGHNPLICVVIDEKATELPAGLLLHHTALRMLILADLLLLRSFPEELTQLTALQQLIIRNCSELSGRCRVGGELWPKIAHIPHIKIDGKDIRSA